MERNWTHNAAQSISGGQQQGVQVREDKQDEAGEAKQASGRAGKQKYI